MSIFIISSPSHHWYSTTANWCFHMFLILLRSQNCESHMRYDHCGILYYKSLSVT